MKGTEESLLLTATATVIRGYASPRGSADAQLSHRASEARVPHYLSHTRLHPSPTPLAIPSCTRMSPPVLAIVAAGAMGAAVGRRLTSTGLTVLTSLAGRSPATRKRAADAGMRDASLADIAAQAHWVLSILPPAEAVAFAQRFRDAHAATGDGGRALGFADCNAVNPTTVQRIAALFQDTPIKFVDAGIIGGPPQGDYDPVFYASVDPKDDAVLDEFASLKQYGLNVKSLRGEGAGVGDASALKMSYAVRTAIHFVMGKPELMWRTHCRALQRARTVSLLL
jgi:hypothetical protein